MSLTDKRIDITFDETNEEEMIAAITQTVYNIIKDVFIDSIIDDTVPMIYFDQEKKNGIRFTKTMSGSSSRFSIEFLINNTSHIYSYSSFTPSSYKILYYNTSISQDIFAFGFHPGSLNFGIGYQTEIGFWGFYIGEAYTNSYEQDAHLLLSSYDIKRHQSYSQTAIIRWTSSDFPHLSLIQLPLFVQQGNFNNLYELNCCDSNRVINPNETFFSYNGKYYRLIHTYDFSENRYNLGKHGTIVLAMEIAKE